MMAFPSMLLEPAAQAGMSHPTGDFDEENLDSIKEEYPHFFIFCQLQLGRRMEPGEHWENAKVIAKIPTKELVKMTVEDFRKRGVQISP